MLKERFGERTKLKFLTIADWADVFLGQKSMEGILDLDNMSIINSRQQERLTSVRAMYSASSASLRRTSTWSWGMFVDLVVIKEHRNKKRKGEQYTSTRPTKAVVLSRNLQSGKSHNQGALSYSERPSCSQSTTSYNLPVRKIL
jgi:hypothetical protein